MDFSWKLLEPFFFFQFSLATVHANPAFIFKRNAKQNANETKSLSSNVFVCLNIYCGFLLLFWLFFFLCILFFWFSPLYFSCSRDKSRRRIVWSNYSDYFQNHIHASRSKHQSKRNVYIKITPNRHKQNEQIQTTKRCGSNSSLNGAAGIKKEKNSIAIASNDWGDFVMAKWQ